jgi:hypothetical protein
MDMNITVVPQSELLTRAFAVPLFEETELSELFQHSFAKA